MNLYIFNLLGGAVILFLLSVMEGFLVKHQDLAKKHPAFEAVLRMLNIIVVLLAMWCFLSLVTAAISILSGEASYVATSLLQLVRIFGWEAMISGPEELRSMLTDHPRYLTGLSSLATGVMGYCGFISLLSLRRLLKEPQVGKL